MRKKIIIGLGVMAVAAIVTIIWLVPAKPRVGPWRLSDGSELSLAGVTYGKKHAMRYGNRVVDYLYPVLSPAMRKKFGCKVAECSTMDTNAIVIWFWNRGLASGRTTFGARSSLPQSVFIAAMDERGMESGRPFYPGTTVIWQKTNVLMAEVLADFPRRSREIGVRIYQPREGAQSLAKFQIPNRTATNYPVWTANPLPITVRTNDLEVSLVSLETGVEKNGIRTGTRARFKFVKNQQVCDDWVLLRVSATSATGEKFDSLTLDMSHPSEQAVSLNFMTLWLEEPAWKLTAELRRATNYPAAERWTVKGVPVQGEGKTRQINLTTNIYGSEIELVSISGEEVSTNKSDGRAYRTLVARLQSPIGRADVRLRLAEAVDDQGRKMGFVMDAEVPSTGGKGMVYNVLDKDYIIYAPADAKNMDLTLAYTKSVFVEFMAKPTAAKE